MVWGVRCGKLVGPFTRGFDLHKGFLGWELGRAGCPGRDVNQFG